VLAEERLDLAVESARLGPGEKVIVVTKMGREVARGEVGETIPNGPVLVKVKDQGDKGVAEDRLYDPQFYSFVPLEEAPEEERSDPDVDEDPPEPSLQGSDDRAEAKLKELGLTLVEQPQTAGAGVDKTPGNGDGGGQKTPPQAPPKASTKNAPDIRKDVSEPEASVDPNQLPDALKKKLVGVGGLDEAQRDKVVSEISDAALRALRDVGVKNHEIFSTVTKIQEVVLPVLEKKG